jgi:hypothetical protein
MSAFFVTRAAQRNHETRPKPTLTLTLTLTRPKPTLTLTLTRVEARTPHARAGVARVQLRRVRPAVCSNTQR